MPRFAYYAGLIWLVGIAIQILMLGLDVYLGAWPGFGWLCVSYNSCRVFLDAWYGSLLLLSVFALPAAALWGWGKAQIKRAATTS